MRDRGVSTDAPEHTRETTAQLLSGTTAVAPPVLRLLLEDNGLFVIIRLFCHPRFLAGPSSSFFPAQKKNSTQSKCCDLVFTQLRRLRQPADETAPAVLSAEAVGGAAGAGLVGTEEAGAEVAAEAA